jgi:hydrogenase nickel incorporation protein HypA/HybF
VHELSIATNLISLALEAIQNKSPALHTSAPRVDQVTLRVGRLAGVDAEALQFCYEIATRDTPLAGSQLVIEEVPAVVYCPACQAERELPSVQRFVCPECGQPTAELRRGRELELTCIQLVEPDTVSPPAG